MDWAKGRTGTPEQDSGLENATDHRYLLTTVGVCVLH